MNEIQKTSKSMIWWIGLATAVAQAILGIMLTAGYVTAEMSGAIMTAFAVIMQWANGNNPNVAGTYAPSVQSTQLGKLK